MCRNAGELVFGFKTLDGHTAAPPATSQVATVRFLPAPRALVLVACSLWGAEQAREFYEASLAAIRSPGQSNANESGGSGHYYVRSGDEELTSLFLVATAVVPAHYESNDHIAQVSACNTQPDVASLQAPARFHLTKTLWGPTFGWGVVICHEGVAQLVPPPPPTSTTTATTNKQRIPRCTRHRASVCVGQPFRLTHIVPHFVRCDMVRPDRCETNSNAA